MPISTVTRNKPLNINPPRGSLLHNAAITYNVLKPSHARAADPTCHGRTQNMPITTASTVIYNRAHLMTTTPGSAMAVESKEAMTKPRSKRCTGCTMRYSANNITWPTIANASTNNNC